MPKTPVVLLFVDGVGIGENNAEVNPLSRAPFLLSQFLDGSGTHLDNGQRFDLDACLSVSGRPQSASNQATLYTGQNVPLALGKHLLGFPNAATSKLIATHSIFLQMKKNGARVRLLNAFPSELIELLNTDQHVARPTGWARRFRPSASVLAMQAAAVPLRSFEAVERRTAIPHDLTGATARAHGMPVAELSADQAVQVIFGEDADFTLFEYFLTDFAGHNRSFDEAHHSLTQFDDFLRAILAQKPDNAQVVVVSDHGNIEDLSHRNHTRNKVPFLSFGPLHVSELARLDEVGALLARWVVS